MVSGHPKHRPNGGTWDDWVKAGYMIFTTTPAELQKLLAAGTLAAKHGYKNALYRFEVGDTVTVRVQEARDQTADSINYGPLTGVLAAPVHTWFSLRHDLVEPLWTSLSAIKAKEVTLMHHPDDGSFNVIVSEEQPTALRLGEKITCFERARAQRKE